MWQIVNDQVGVKIKDSSHKELLNELADKLQQQGQKIESGYDFMMAMFNEIKRLENDLTTAENDLISSENELKSVFEATENKLRSRIEAAESEVKHLNEQLEAAQNRPAPEPVVKEVEIVKEIEKQLSDNQVIINLNPSQKTIIEVIAERRHRAGNDKALNSVEKQIVDLVFNKQTLFNWAGNYPTHLKLSELSH